MQCGNHTGFENQQYVLVQNQLNCKNILNDCITIVCVTSDYTVLIGPSLWPLMVDLVFSCGICVKPQVNPSFSSLKASKKYIFFFKFPQRYSESSVTNGVTQVSQQLLSVSISVCDVMF